MKKLWIALVLLLALCCILAACGGNSGTTDNGGAENGGAENSSTNNSGTENNTPLLHVHLYTEQNTDTKFLASEATCKVAATYYYSCRCGEKGTETFASGELGGHAWENDVCQYCGKKAGDGLKFYSRGDGTCYVSGIGTCADTDLVIPTTSPVGDSVTSIGFSALYNCTSLTSVTIPDSVTSIGSEAFYGCKLLTSVTIPDSVTSIGNYAFYNCTSLTSVTIPDSVTSIGDYAFSGCASLNYTIYKNGKYLGNSENPYMYLAGVVRGTTILDISDSTKIIGSYAASDHHSIASVTIPESVISIGHNAFQDCYNLLEVYNCSELLISVGGNNYGYIGYNAKNVYTPTSGESKLNITTDGYVFYVDSSTCYLMGKTDALQQTSLTLPANCNGNSYEIRQYSFEGCESLVNVTIGNGVTSIGGCAFDGCTSLTSVTIPDSVTSIGYAAFDGCTSLTSVTIPDGVTSIGDSVFCDCTSLTSVTIGDSVTSIGSSAFRDCTSLTSVTIPDSVTSIGSSAFENCTSLTSVTIPNSVMIIGEYAFYYCTSLTSVTIGEGVASIGDSAFRGCKALTEIKFNATAMNDLSSGNDVFAYAGQDGAGITVTFGDNVTKIPAYLFYPYSNSSYAPKITSVTIGDSVTSIGSYAFRNCTSLTSITVDAGNTAFQSIDGNLYSKDGKTLIQYAIGKTATSFTIPDSVTSIDSYAFRDCSSLASVTIPDGVTSIGEYAFNGCTSLTSVTIGDSVTSIGERAFYYCTSLTSVTFENPNGWWRSSSSATSGTSVNVSNSATAATYLTSTYYDYYWKRT